MAMNHHQVPILGQGNLRSGTSMGAIVRRLDDQGTYEPEGVLDTANGPQVIAGRRNFVDATELVEMMRAMVREEIARDRALQPNRAMRRKGGASP